MPKLRISAKSVSVRVTDEQDDNRESPLSIHLGQVMSRGEKWNSPFRNPLNWVFRLLPLISERCGVKLDGERLEKNSSSGRKLPSPPASSADVT